MLWIFTLLGLGFMPIIMKQFAFAPLMVLAVVIAATGVLIDGATTIILKKMNGTELNPIMNILFSKVGVRWGLVITRLVGFVLITYGMLSGNAYLILAMSWFFMLAGFIGISSIALTKSKLLS